MGLRTTAAVEIGMIIRVRIGNETHPATVVRCRRIGFEYSVGLRLGEVGDTDPIGPAETASITS